MTPTIDLATAANALLALASAAVTAAIPVLVAALLRRLHVANDAALAGKLTTAADAAAGAAYKFAAEHEGGLANVAVHNAALAMGANYVLAQMPDTLKALGVTPAQVSAMVAARLGTLLASDPTVSAGAPPKAAAAPPVPISATPSATQ